MQKLDLPLIHSYQGSDLAQSDLHVLPHAIMDAPRRLIRKLEG